MRLDRFKIALIGFAIIMICVSVCVVSATGISSSELKGLMAETFMRGMRRLKGIIENICIWGAC